MCTSSNSSSVASHRTQLTQLDLWVVLLHTHAANMHAAAAVTSTNSRQHTQKSWQIYSPFFQNIVPKSCGFCCSLHVNVISLPDLTKTSAGPVILAFSSVNREKWPNERWEMNVQQFFIRKCWVRFIRWGETLQHFWILNNNANCTKWAEVHEFTSGWNREQGDRKFSCSLTRIAKNCGAVVKSFSLTHSEKVV